MSALKLTKSRRLLLLVIGVFVLPVVLAKLALNEQWFDYGVTNQGELVGNELTLTDLGLKPEQFNQQWLMLVNLPEQCDDFCQKTLLIINNAYTLLGKEIPRVTPVALIENNQADITYQAMHHKKWQAYALPEEAKKVLDHQQLLIVDPLSNIVLSYPLPTEEAEVNKLGKAVIADMKKLLKYSRIG